MPHRGLGARRLAPSRRKIFSRCHIKTSWPKETPMTMPHRTPHTRDRAAVARIDLILARLQRPVTILTERHNIGNEIEHLLAAVAPVRGAIGAWTIGQHLATPEPDGLVVASGSSNGQCPSLGG